MTKKKKAKKKTSTVKKVEVADKTPDPVEESTPEPAIAEEEMFKVVEQGQATYYTESEYRAKYGPKGK